MSDCHRLNRIRWTEGCKQENIPWTPSFLIIRFWTVQAIRALETESDLSRASESFYYLSVSLRFSMSQQLSTWGVKYQYGFKRINWVGRRREGLIPYAFSYATELIIVTCIYAIADFFESSITQFWGNWTSNEYIFHIRRPINSGACLDYLRISKSWYEQCIVPRWAYSSLSVHQSSSEATSFKVCRA